MAAERPRRFARFKCNRETSDGGVGKGDKIPREALFAACRWVRTVVKLRFSADTLLDLCGRKGIKRCRMFRKQLAATVQLTLESGNS